MISTPTTTSRPTGPMLAVSFTVFLDLVGFGMILPLLPFYAERFGASPFEIGLLFASYSLAQFIASPFWGRLSDRVGRRRPLLVSIALGFAAYALLASAQTLALVFLARILAGAAAANYTIAQAFVADVYKVEDRTKAMGWLGAAFGLGFVFGPALAGGLSRLGVSAVPIGAAILAAINFLLVWRAVPESRRLEAGEQKTIAALKVTKVLRRSRRLLPLLTLYGVVIFGFSAMETTLALFCARRLGFGVAETSWLFLFVGLVMVLVQAGMIGRLVERFGESWLLAIGLLAMTLGILLLPAVHSLASLLPAAALLAVGSALYTPSSFGLTSRLAPEQSQGTVLGLARSLGALARVVGPVWGGWAFHRLGMTSPFISSGVVLAACTLAALWMVHLSTSPTECRIRIGEAL